MTHLTHEELDTRAAESFAKFWQAESLRKLTTERTARECHKYGFCEGSAVATERAEEMLQELLRRLREAIAEVDSTESVWSAYRRGVKDAAVLVQEVFGVKGKERIV